MVLLVLWAVVLLLLLAVLALSLPLERWTWVLWVALPLEHGGVPPTHFLPATQGHLQLAAVVVQLGSKLPAMHGIAAAVAAVAALPAGGAAGRCAGGAAGWCAGAAALGAV